MHYFFKRYFTEGTDIIKFCNIKIMESQNKSTNSHSKEQIYETHYLKNLCRWTF